MKQWHCVLLSLFTLGFAAAAAANTTPEPGNFSIEASYLYWSNSPVSGFTGANIESFVISNGSPPAIPGATNDATVRKNYIGFAPGLRLAAIYAFQSMPLLARISFSQILPATNRTITGQYLMPFNTSRLGLGLYSGSATSNIKAKYQNVDLLIGKNILNHDPISMTFYIGLNYLYSGVKIHAIYQSTTAQQVDRTRLKLSGIGPEFYIDNYLKLTKWGCGDLSMRGSIQAGFIVTRGPSSKNFENVNGVTIVDTKIPASTIVNPQFDIRLALSYSNKIGNNRIAVEAGYEFLTYNIVSAHGPFATLIFNL